MWSLQSLLFTLCIALRCVTTAVGVIQVTGFLGKEVKVSCTYNDGYETYEKYFCKNNCGDSDVLIRTVLIRTSQPRGKHTQSMMTKGHDVFSTVELEVQEWCCAKSKLTIGTAGHPLTLQCPYPPQHQDNRKFLCKGDHRKNCTDMVMNQSRFTLQDDALSSSFSVMITDLEAADAGTYWCGSDSLWSIGSYTKIELSIDRVQYALYAVVPVALLMCILVIIYKYKCYKVREAEAVINRNTLNAEEVIDGGVESGIYGTQDFSLTCKQQNDWNHFDDPGGDEPDEELYCNENYHKANRR